ncbi:hypothetical protein NQT62_02240 [Limnobacter humi]|uniref:Uncharacterized protein n=1 Tax=Limnobacter humi TaxID=1778671 RepID=A0ABT1WCL4_9BURK|nr:hypothetical protein [Limnobacter humi]MCQ8895257.1 hypothetical protein [Limnobacter humi]
MHNPMAMTLAPVRQVLACLTVASGLVCPASKSTAVQFFGDAVENVAKVVIRVQLQH